MDINLNDYNTLPEQVEDNIDEINTLISRVDNITLADGSLKFELYETNPITLNAGASTTLFVTDIPNGMTLISYHGLIPNIDKFRECAVTAAGVTIQAAKLSGVEQAQADILYISTRSGNSQDFGMVIGGSSMENYPLVKAMPSGSNGFAVKIENKGSSQVRIAELRYRANAVNSIN